jgi:uncharacterized protein (DUF302 family)
VRILFALLLATGAAAQQPAPGLVRLKSESSMAVTLERLGNGIRSRGLTLFATIDHAANARGAGLDLPATTLFILGNPQLGTRLMQCDRSVAIDLPLKLLVWEDGRTVWVGYEDPASVAERHGIQGCAEVVDRMKAGLAALAREAAGR